MILHADADAFYASVAQRDDPALRGRPVAVGGWVVMAASYEARAFGVRGGMSAAGRGGGARRDRRRDVVGGVIGGGPATVVRDLPAAGAGGRAGVAEEAFLDVSEVDAPAPEIAATLRREVREEAGLPLSVGVARTKVLAKIASRSAKPDGLFVVAPGSASSSSCTRCRSSASGASARRRRGG